MFNCPFCYPEVENSLSILDPTNEEFYITMLTNDGTRKWFSCSNCNGVFCKDKLNGRWQLSPKTYDLFLKLGMIKNLLEDLG